MFGAGRRRMTIYKEDIEDCQHRVEAWWIHKIIDRVVVQVRAPLNKTELGFEDFSEMTPEAVEAWFVDENQVFPRLKGLLANTYFGGEAFPVMQPFAPLLKRIQEVGKLVYAYCDKSHVQKLLDELSPEGLMLVVEGCQSRDEADELLENVTKWSKRASLVN
jgi:hypothetical protein